MALALAVVAASGQPVLAQSLPRSLVLGGSFEVGARGWTLPPAAEVRPAEDAPHGECVLRVTEGRASQDMPDCRPGSTYSLDCWAREEGVRATASGGHAFVAIYEYGDLGEMLSFWEEVLPEGSAPWKEVTHTLTVGPDTSSVRIECGLWNAEGTAWFDGFTLVEGDRPVPASAVAEVDSAPVAVRGFRPSAAGNVAILRDDMPSAGAPSDPLRLAGALRQAGLGVALLDSRQLADRRNLNAGAFDVLVLPYGPSFPAAAAGNLRRFLRTGGKLLSTGGYAFDDLMEERDGQWRKLDPPAPESVSIAYWNFRLPAPELRGKGLLTYSGSLRCSSVSGRGFAYLAVYQYGPGGRIVAWRSVKEIRGSQDWGSYSYELPVHDDAETVNLQAGLFNCTGIAWADDLRLTDAAGNVLVQSDFTQPWDIDSNSPRVWARTDKQACSVDEKGGLKGGSALRIRLAPNRADPEPLNTRTGTAYADHLEVSPGQLGVFQPDVRLQHAVGIRPAAGQCVFDRNARLDLPPGAPPLEGYAAVGLVGHSEARWQPLLDAVDRYGRPRGAAGALLRHHSGCYAGSSWAYFGVTDHDLFSARGGPGPEGFVSLVKDLVRDTYLVTVAAEPPCAQPGENVALRARVFNAGRATRTLHVSFSIEPQEAGGEVYHRLARLVLPPGQKSQAAIHWRAPAAGPGFYRVMCEIRDNGRRVDTLEGGVVVWRPEIVARGPRISLRDNLLRVNDMPRFLFGTDDWGYVFWEDRETPATWRFDAAQRRDMGVQIYENLQTGTPPSGVDRETFFRKCDGVVQLAQQYGQVYFAGLLIGANVAVSDDELARHAEWCAAFARRYHDVPGLIYYLNGDLRCLLDSVVTPQWNEFLRDRYGTDAALRAAWGGRAPEQPLGAIPAAAYEGSAWDDVRAYDTTLFRAYLIRRWTGALVRAIKAEDPDALTSCEFYQLPAEGVDIPEGIGDLDLSNIGFFDTLGEDVRRFPAILQYSDQRARGKSLGPGEYGAIMHPAWEHAEPSLYATRSPEQALDLYLAVPHYALGIGASRIHNWCWKDGTHNVFPWGMVYPCDSIPKGIALAHRAQSLLFRQLQPVYRKPEVYVLAPDSHRLGGQGSRVIEGILRCIELAQAAHVENLGVLNERAIAGEMPIPPEARVIFYPLPYCPSDAAYERLRDWVRAGGVLYLSGDISCDEARRRTRTARLEELCGVRLVGERYPNIDYGERPAVALAAGEGWSFSPGQPGLDLQPADPTTEVVATTPDGAPAAVVHSLGQGRVVFLAEPMELHTDVASRSVDVGVYRKVLDLAGVAPLRVEPDDPFLHVFRVALTDGGSAWVLFDADETQGRREVALPSWSTGASEAPLRFELSRRWPGFAWCDGEGRLRAIEAAGYVRLGDRVLMECSGQTLAFSADGADLRQCGAIVAVPLAPGPLRVCGASWRRPAAVLGEVREGQWRRLADLPVTRVGDMVEVGVPAEAAGSILLIGERNASPAAARAVEAWMTQ